MAVEERDVAAGRPALLTSLGERLREIGDARAYRDVAAQTKYPVGAMLTSQTLLVPGMAVALSRLLGARHYGEYALIITIAGMFQLLAAFPVEQGTARFIAESRQERPAEVRAYYTAGLSLRLTAGLLALAVAALSARALTRAFGLPDQTGPLLLAALSLCLLAPVGQFFLACVQGAEQPSRWATGNLLTSFTAFPLALAGAGLFAGRGQLVLFACIAAGWAVAAVACAVLARRALGFLAPAGWRWSHVRRLVLFLLPMWIVPIAGFGAKTIIGWYLAHASGAVAVGQFDIATKLLMHLGTVYQACMIVFMPGWTRLYAARQASALLHSIAQARGVLLGIAFSYGGLLVVTGQWVVPGVFGADQAGAVPAARVMGFIMPIMISGWVASATNVVSDRTRNVGMANVIWFSLVVPLGIALIPALHALGGALAWAGAYCVFAWFYISRARPFFREVEAWREQQQPQIGAD
jgi:O-antigen/teichoic acid export membrane protein